MEMQPVESSNIQSIGYDPAQSVMHVAFKSGGVYAYHNVAPHQHQALMSAQSVGGHLSRVLKPTIKKILKV